MNLARKLLLAFVLLMTSLLLVSLWRPEQMVPLLRRVARTVNDSMYSL